jgi:hypothetical protein
VKIPTGERGGRLVTVAGPLEEARRARAWGVADAGTVRAAPARTAETLHGRTYAHMLSDERLDGFAVAQRANAGVRGGVGETAREPKARS